MADPIVITAVAGIIGRLIDKKKPLGATNITTVGGTGLGAAAAMLIQDPQLEAQILGYVLGAVAVGMALYKEKGKE